MGRRCQAEEARVKWLALALLLTACATPRCYPKLQIHHEGMKATGAYVGAYCQTKGYL